MKSGTSFHDRNNIRDYVQAGETDASVISSRLGIQIEVVQRLVDKMTAPKELTRGQKAAATRAANKAAEDSAA